jgi:CDP-4-dehydro-6-deoxyglucose reductase, E3
MIRRLQSLLRGGFMRVEALFNRAFGQHVNPLYHLGAIAFFLFWIVAGSGLYLYAFFDTSVAGAYASVDALTREQRYAGGVLRSAHRYASDAMVVVMFVHLLRHFAFDRLRGFRSFAWLTGVSLIWLVYIAGVNGYMLPWDRLAQFVVTASFEWLSALPGFGGELIRNVIDPESVNDRLFSLLVFIHIGVPLITLLIMWIHVQRVPKASVNPPRPLALGTLALLLALALVQPVASQGGAADLASAPPSLQLDWFYLGGFPLLYRWSAAGVWMLAGALTVLLALAPWLPLRRRTPDGELRVDVQPGSHTASARRGETLLEAGLRAGLALPYECRNGGCGLCMCTVVRGEVEQGAFQPSVLTDALRAQGKALLCCASPLTDVEIEVDAPAKGRVATLYEARVQSLERLAPDVMRVWLALPGGARFEFEAGQYVNVVLDDGQRRAFSCANPPHENELIELHVRLIPGGRFTTYVFETLAVGDVLRFEGPFGRFTLRESTKPILFVAGATGFAPVKSIVEDAWRRGVERQMHLYWGVRRQQDLYMLELVERWRREHANFTATPVLSGDVESGWAGRRGLVHEAMLADYPDLRGVEVYVCGSVKMVETAVPAFLARGLSEEACISDAFLPAAPASDAYRNR